jgi:(1->4)-alpha-D-glucan 1-alpha-D-glucosylmutase
VLKDRVFQQDLRKFVTKLIRPGRINSLVLTLIKLTAPGVPDIYQGTELWDLSLVDPDNRRPVDFDQRKKLLSELNGLSAEEIMNRMDEGMPKLWLIRQALYLRHEHPEYFGRDTEYRPLYAQGAMADHLVAFIRGGGAISLAPRLTMQMKDRWEETALELPGGRWRNILTGDEMEGGAIPIRELLRRFPVGLLVIKDDQA